MDYIKYSFIVPVKEINDYIRESIPKILEINRDDFEIIIYPNELPVENCVWGKTKIIASGSSGQQRGPAYKRNLAIKDAQGDILIFIDDDAYLENNFLDILDKDFNDQSISAVGGPAVTPPNDNFWQKVAGAVSLSSLSGGFPERFAPVGKKRFIDDWPSVNLSIRKSIFEKIGGFDCSYWPGEDTKLCLDIVKSGGKILYNPDLIVYHHRRPGLMHHLKQQGGYGLHRGFFAKKFPETSFRLKSFPPSALVLFVICGAVLSYFYQWALYLYLLGWGVYILALLKASYDIYKHEKNVLIVLNAVYYIFLTHIWYGIRFIQGFVFTKDLKSKLR